MIGFNILDASWALWATFITAGLLTYAIRLSFILFFSNRNIPRWLDRSLRFVPPAVLSAIILPELLIRDGNPDISSGNLRLIAGLVAILVAWRTKSAIITILVGMGLLWALQIVMK